MYISSFYLLNFYFRKFLQKVNYSLDVQSTIVFILFYLFYNYCLLLCFTCLNSVCNTKSSIDKTLAETIKISPQLWWSIIALLSFLCLLYDAINTINVVLYPPPTEQVVCWSNDDVNISRGFWRVVKLNDIQQCLIMMCTGCIFCQ